MEKFAELISILLQHSQRFFDFWNFQIVVSLAVLGFVFANQEVVSRLRVRLVITLVFLLIILFSIFSLSVHQQREEKLWLALESRVSVAQTQYTPQEIEYLESLKPSSFLIKAGALVAADVLVILAAWFGPRLNRKD